MLSNRLAVLRLTGAMAAALALGHVAWTAEFMVDTTDDSGPGSLRQAMIDANQNGEDDTIRFAADLAGGRLLPAEPLPPLTEGGTRIIGDTDRDQDPDIVIDGSECTQRWTSGIWIQSDANVISKLVISGFTVAQILIDRGSRNTIRGCLINTDRAGTRAVRDGDGIWIVRGTRNYIGVAGAGGNLIAARAYCVAILNSSGNSVANNLIGVDITGTVRLMTSGVGVAILSAPLPCRNNSIGGADAGLRNVITGPQPPILISGRAAHHNEVMGNYLDLKADGTGPIADRRATSIVIADGAYYNTIGGKRSDGGNAIFGGMQITGGGTADNRVLGNYIGLNAQGRGSYRGPRGITVDQGAGKQYIGGADPEEGNYICGGVSVNAVEFYGGGKGSVVRNNVIGTDVLGQPSGRADGGVAVYYTDVTLRQNTLTGLKARGIYVHDGSPIIRDNVFSKNPAAVIIGESGTPRLGDLSNGTPGDDGGNLFLPDNDWFIYSYSRRNVLAENNNFSTAAPAQISAKIWDRRDDPALGWVDFRPFIVAPASASARPLTLTSLVAVPTRQGAEVLFSLSQPATVTGTVRNIAGRPIRALRSDATRVQGSNMLLWDGRAEDGCRVPAGQYVVEVNARSDDGQQARRLTTLSLPR